MSRAVVFRCAENNKTTHGTWRRRRRAHVHTHLHTHTHTLAHTQTHTQTHTGGQGIAVDWDIAEAWYRKFFAERSDWSKQLEKADAALEDGGCF